MREKLDQLLAACAEVRRLANEIGAGGVILYRSAGVSIANVPLAVQRELGEPRYHEYQGGCWYQTEIHLDDGDYYVTLATEHVPVGERERIENQRTVEAA